MYEKWNDELKKINEAATEQNFYGFYYKKTRVPERNNELVTPTGEKGVII